MCHENMQSVKSEGKLALSDRIVRNFINNIFAAHMYTDVLTEAMPNLLMKFIVQLDHCLL